MFLSFSLFKAVVVAHHATIYGITMRFTCFGQVQPPGCIAPSGTLSSQAPVSAVSIVFLSLCLGGGGVSLRAAGNHPVVKIIIAGTKYQASLNHHQRDRRPSFVFID